MSSVETANLLPVFFESLSNSSQAALVIDYDSVIKPNSLPRNTSIPNTSLMDILDSAVITSRTQIAVVCERQACDLLSVFSKLPRPEIWGVSGIERLLPDGTYDLSPLGQDVQTAFALADTYLQRDGLGSLVTLTSSGMFVTWSGLSEQDKNDARICALRILSHFDACHGLSVLESTDGIQVLLKEKNLGRVFSTLHDELPSNTPIAYLTANIACLDSLSTSDRLLRVSVTEQLAPPRSENVDVCLRPDELVHFLTAWVVARGGEV